MDTIKINSKNVKMIAHKGLSSLEPENTNPAFVAAGNRSYYGIETDIHVTADERFVVIHDETTARVSLERVDINVEESSYAELEGIVLPDFDGSTVRSDIRIPLLEEYVNICKKYDKKCVLELKNPFERKHIEKLVEEIRGLDYLDGMIYISFSWENCIMLRELLPDAKIQWLISEEDFGDSDIDALVKNHLDLDIRYSRLTKELVEKLHKAGIEVNCWTCDEKEIGEELVEMGVDYITTNILE